MQYQVCANAYGAFTVVEEGANVPKGMRTFHVEGFNQFHALGKALYAGIMAVNFLEAEYNGDEDEANRICDELEVAVDEITDPGDVAACEAFHAAHADPWDALYERRMDK